MKGIWLERVASCHFLFSWDSDRHHLPEGRASAPIDWMGPVQYRVLYSLPSPFGWSGKAGNAEKEDMGKRK